MQNNPAALDLEKQELFGRRIALVSISLGVLLAIAKILVGIHAGSTSVISDGLEASGDALSSAIVYAGLWLASKPPDYEHPYGHGRYETLAGLAVGGMLFLAGVAIFWHGLTAAGPPERIQLYALYPLFAAVVLKSALAAIKFRTGARIRSSSLQADAWHDLTDLLSTFIAMLAVGLTLMNPVQFGAADRIGGMVIGIIIFFLSVQVVRRTIGQLLDTMPEPAKMAEIREVALSVPGAMGIEKCFARRTGMRYHVDLHLEVDPDMTVRESHEIATSVKHAIKERLEWVADVLVHVEPANTLDDDAHQLRKRAVAGRAHEQ
jgi:cation diffusion facilitator family transporter